jgi:hypothetical protein
LASYILDANTVYTVEVTVTVDEPGGNKAKYMVNLEIGQQGVVASILGGAVRSGSHNNDVFFVSGSYDIDYPTDSSNLLYEWTCRERSPNYGAECPMDLTVDDDNRWRSLIGKGDFKNGNALIDDVTYDITLFVRNQFGRHGQASVAITLVFSDLPDIDFQPVPVKYNPNQKIVISSEITAVKDALVDWSCIEFSDASAFEQIVLTKAKIRSIVGAGSTISELAIAPNSLVAGMSYTMT